MLHNPTTPMGALTWIGLGLAAAVVALAVGSMFPQIIPARATTVKV